MARDATDPAQVPPTPPPLTSASPTPASPISAGAERRWVKIEGLAVLVRAGDLAAASELAEQQLDTRLRQAFRRDLARAFLDRGQIDKAREVAKRIEDSSVQMALGREITRVAEGGDVTPPAGDIIAVVIDNDQPGNPEKQTYVRGFQSPQQALAWAECRVRASLERYRKAGESPGEPAHRRIGEPSVDPSDDGRNGHATSR